MSTVAEAPRVQKPRQRKSAPPLTPASGKASLRVALPLGEFKIVPTVSETGQEGYFLIGPSGHKTFLDELFPFLLNFTAVLRITSDTTSGPTETFYALREIECDPTFGYAAYELKKTDGSKYHLHIGEHGSVCDCPDFVFRRDKSQDKTLRECKHIKALCGFRLLPSAA